MDSKTVGRGALAALAIAGAIAGARFWQQRHAKPNWAEEAQQELNDADAELRRTDRELRRVDRELDATERELDATEKELDRTDRQLERMDRTVLEEAEKETDF